MSTVMKSVKKLNWFDNFNMEIIIFKHLRVRIWIIKIIESIKCRQEDCKLKDYV